MTRLAINRLINFAASPAIFFYTMPWLMILVIGGTLVQPSMGLHEAVNQVFAAWIIWLNFIPLPGGMLTLAVLTINLSARFLFKSEWVWHKAGIHLSHLGVLILLLGGMGTSLLARENYMIIPEGKTSAELYAYKDGEIQITPPTKSGELMKWGEMETTLPFSLTLLNFVRQNYVGTDMAKSYHSDINVKEDGETFAVRIGMNEPLRYGGYTFFQSSFIDVGSHQATVLQVTRNEAALFPYISTFIIAAGLILHLILMRKRIG